MAAAHLPRACLCGQEGYSLGLEPHLRSLPRTEPSPDPHIGSSAAASRSALAAPPSVKAVHCPSSWQLRGAQLLPLTALAFPLSSPTCGLISETDIRRCAAWDLHNGQGEHGRRPRRGSLSPATGRCPGCNHQAAAGARSVSRPPESVLGALCLVPRRSSINVCAVQERLSPEGPRWDMISNFSLKHVGRRVLSS